MVVVVVGVGVPETVIALLSSANLQSVESNHNISAVGTEQRWQRTDHNPCIVCVFSSFK